MTDATLKGALRELREDLDQLFVDLETEIAGIVGDGELAEDDLITEEGDSISIDMVELKSLFARLDDASEAAADAFKTFDQEVERVWRRFKQALASETVEG
jgi:hypothetical protein